MFEDTKIKFQKACETCKDYVLETKAISKERPLHVDLGSFTFYPPSKTDADITNTDYTKKHFSFLSQLKASIRTIRELNNELIKDDKENLNRKSLLIDVTNVLFRPVASFAIAAVLSNSGKSLALIACAVLATNYLWELAYTRYGTTIKYKTFINNNLNLVYKFAKSIASFSIKSKEEKDKIAAVNNNLIDITKIRSNCVSVLANGLTMLATGLAVASNNPLLTLALVSGGILAVINNIKSTQIISSREDKIGGSRDMNWEHRVSLVNAESRADIKRNNNLLNAILGLFKRTGLKINEAVVESNLHISKRNSLIELIPTIAKLSVIGAIANSLISNSYEIQQSLALSLVAIYSFTDMQKVFGESLGSLFVNMNFADKYLYLLQRAKEADNLDKSKKEITNRDQVTIGLRDCVFFQGAGNNKVTIEIQELTLSPSKITVIKGPSGNGKSSLARAIMGEVELIKGKLSINNENYDEIKEQDFRNLVYYDSNSNMLIQDLSPLENVTLLAQQTDTNRLQEVLALVNLEITHLKELENSRNLSTGEAKRVQLARALYSNAKVLILDEPTANLDKDNRFDVSEKLIQHCKNNNISLVIITHDDESLKGADQVVKLNKTIDSDGSSHCVATVFTKGQISMEQFETMIREDGAVNPSIAYNARISTSVNNN